MIRPVTLWPFPEKIIAETALKTKKFLVVEMSAGQMVEDVMLAVNGKAEVDFYGRMGGGVPGRAGLGPRGCDEFRPAAGRLGGHPGLRLGRTGPLRPRRSPSIHGALSIPDR